MGCRIMKQRSDPTRLLATLQEPNAESTPGRRQDLKKVLILFHQWLGGNRNETVLET